MSRWRHFMFLGDLWNFFTIITYNTICDYGKKIANTARYSSCNTARYAFELALGNLMKFLVQE